MNAKKFLAVLLALVLCLGTLAACDSKPAETTAPAAEGTTAPAAETTAPAQETTEAAPLTNAEIYPISSDHTFKVLTTRSNIEDTANWHMMVDTIGLDVEWVVSTSEQVPLTFIDKGSMPDIYFQPAGLTPEQINEYGKSGLLVNYADYTDAQYAEVD